MIESPVTCYSNTSSESVPQKPPKAEIVRERSKYKLKKKVNKSKSIEEDSSNQVSNQSAIEIGSGTDSLLTKKPAKLKRSSSNFFSYTFKGRSKTMDNSSTIQSRIPTRAIASCKEMSKDKSSSLERIKSKLASRTGSLRKSKGISSLYSSGNSLVSDSHGSISSLSKEFSVSGTKLAFDDAEVQRENSEPIYQEVLHLDVKDDIPDPVYSDLVDIFQQVPSPVTTLQPSSDKHQQVQSPVTTLQPSYDKPQQVQSPVTTLQAPLSEAPHRPVTKCSVPVRRSSEQLHTKKEKEDMGRCKSYHPDVEIESDYAELGDIINDLKSNRPVIQKRRPALRRKSRSIEVEDIIETAPEIMSEYSEFQHDPLKSVVFPELSDDVPVNIPSDDAAVVYPPEPPKRHDLKDSEVFSEPIAQASDDTKPAESSQLPAARFSSSEEEDGIPMYSVVRKNKITSKSDAGSPGFITIIQHPSAADGDAYSASDFTVKEQFNRMNEIEYDAYDITKETSSDEYLPTDDEILIEIESTPDNDETIFMIEDLGIEGTNECLRPLI